MKCGRYVKLEAAAKSYFTVRLKTLKTLDDKTRKRLLEVLGSLADYFEALWRLDNAKIKGWRTRLEYESAA